MNAEPLRIPFLDLREQHAALAPEINAAVAQVLDRGQYILGPEMAAFEREFAGYLGVAHAIGVASGTDALHLALRACGIGAGDEVITVPNTAVATIAAIELSGATPVLVDVAPHGLNIDLALVEAAITSRTRAILPVHLYGRSAEMAPLIEIARRHGLRIIEDACQAHGASYHGRRVGGWGDIGCFSFYPTKNLGGVGDGGMVTTNDPALAERLRLLRTYGWAERDRSVLKGMNSRLDELQAAILRVKLRHLDEWTARRRALAARYTEALCGLASVRPPEAAVDGGHVYHLYVVRSPQRDRLRDFLAQRDIGSLVHYPHPIHLQEPYRELGHGPGSFPQAEQAAVEILSLPLHPWLTDDQADEVIAALREFDQLIQAPGGAAGGSPRG
ncbi:MAG: DegT/DnrJ/EryC1/StrS family aminotransferase [Dehalococcoidia bacterium]|nr:DegT/DnrJ/EryC1/StrS family aminotransferase [Dehalococcoidia bacterium]